MPKLQVYLLRYTCLWHKSYFQKFVFIVNNGNCCERSIEKSYIENCNRQKKIHEVFPAVKPKRFMTSIFFLFFTVVWLIFSFHGLFCLLLLWNCQGHYLGTNCHYVTYDSYVCHITHWGGCNLCHCSMSHNWLCAATLGDSEPG